MDVQSVASVVLGYLISGGAISFATAQIKARAKTKNLVTLAVVVVASFALNAVGILTGHQAPDAVALATSAMLDALVAVFGYSAVRAAADTLATPELDPRG